MIAVHAAILVSGAADIHLVMCSCMLCPNAAVAVPSNKQAHKAGLRITFDVRCRRLKAITIMRTLSRAAIFRLSEAYRFVTDIPQVLISRQSIAVMGARLLRKYHGNRKAAIPVPAKSSYR